MGGGDEGGEPPWYDSDAPADYPWFSNLWASITERLENVKNSIIGGLVGPFEWIGDAISGLAEGIGRLFQYLNPFSEYFILKVAFVPDSEYIQNFGNEIKELFFEKFEGIPLILESLENLKNYNSSDEIPSFKVNLPSKYGGSSLEIIDLSMYHQYRSLVHNFIRFISLFYFIKWFIRKAPSLVY